MESIAGLLGVLEVLLNWRTLLDVALLTGLIYFLIRTFRLLGTTKVFYGLVAALLLFLAARLLGLKGTDWVFANFAHVALLGFIVIFQPEIRRLLERAGSYRRLPKSGLQGDLFSMQLAEVVYSLAETRWGALFVLPGKESIQPWISSGIGLNADMSLQLVMSLFDPHSPGHDGAVILENGRVVQFGVRLPLSESGKLSNRYGTRHHAAMGLSEVTDALVLLVSEERGTVSLFHAGEMNRVRDRNHAVNEIRKHLEGLSAPGFPASRKSRLSVRVADALVSVVAAVLFCATVVVSQAETREKVLSVPVEYLTPEDAALGGNKVSQVMVHLKGPKSELDRIDPASLPVRIDLTRKQAGRTRVILTADNLRLPRGISVLDIDPDVLELSLNLIRERAAPVTPQLVGSLPDGLKLERVRVVPETVSILVPEARPGSKEPLVTTTPIYLYSIRGSTKILCKIIAPPSVQPAQKSWPDAEVEIVVSPGGGKHPNP